MNQHKERLRFDSKNELVDKLRGYNNSVFLTSSESEIDNFELIRINNEHAIGVGYSIDGVYPKIISSSLFSNSIFIGLDMKFFLINSNDLSIVFEKELSTPFVNIEELHNTFLVIEEGGVYCFDLTHEEIWYQGMDLIENL